MDECDSYPRRSMLPWLVGGSQVLGLVAVVLTGVWMGRYRGGFAWDGSAQEFNLHPLCMVLGLVFLQGDGRSQPRNTLPQEVSRRNPEQMPEPPQLVPLHLEELQLYSELVLCD